MRILAGAAFLVSAAFVSIPVLNVGAAAQGEVCATATYAWNGNKKFLPWDAVANTGVVIPGPAAGETLRVLTATYNTYDQYPDGASPSRAEAGQTHESVGLEIGGVQVGGLSADVPNGVAEGAPTDWFSGVISGSFGGGGTVIPGGELVVKHSSLYGFTESPNSVFISNVTVTVERCTTPTVPSTAAPTTAAPTTAAPTTAAPTTAAPTTTVVSSGGPTTTVTTPTSTPAVGTTPTTTTVVSAGGPTTTIVSAGGPTTTAPSSGGSLPATGGDMTLPLILAALAAGTGTALLMVRRKAGSH